MVGQQLNKIIQHGDQAPSSKLFTNYWPILLINAKIPSILELMWGFSPENLPLIYGARIFFFNSPTIEMLKPKVLLLGSTYPWKEMYRIPHFLVELEGTSRFSKESTIREWLRLKYLCDLFAAYWLLISGIATGIDEPPWFFDVTLNHQKFKRFIRIEVFRIIHMRICGV